MMRRPVSILASLLLALTASAFVSVQPAAAAHCAPEDIACQIFHAPDAVDDTYSTPVNTVLSVAAPGVLANDTGFIFLSSLDTSPTQGTIVFNADGSFTYTPNVGYTGPDSFTYIVLGIFGSDTATVNINVGRVGGGSPRSE